MLGLYLCPRCNVPMERDAAAGRLGLLVWVCPWCSGELWPPESVEKAGARETAAAKKKREKRAAKRRRSGRKRR